jgi:uncharacterized membrane protein
MKEILGMIGGAFVLLVVMSYNTTNNAKIKGIMNPTTIIPLKQKGVFVTTDHAKVNKLIKKGWVVEDVDVISSEWKSEILNYYTLIKY